MPESRNAGPGTSWAGVCRVRHDDRLALQADGERRPHGLFDLRCEVKYFAGGPSEIDNGKGVIGGYARAAAPETTGEARAFHKPRGGDLDAALGRERRDRPPAVPL